jgi:chromosome partitioning protein
LEYLRTAADLEDIRALLMDTVIPRTVRITESELASLPISLYDSRSKGCVAITELIDELQQKQIL